MAGGAAGPAASALARTGRPGGQYDGPVPPGIAASAPDLAAAAPVDTEPAGDTWVGLTAAPLDGDALTRWATTPDVGAVVTFHGTVRDHAPGREGVTALTYEAYEEAAVARLAEVVTDVRRRWPDVRRVAAVHRTGRLEVGESAVVVVVAAPHRGPAFAAAAHGIDTLKATVPLWKKETWGAGEEWGTDARAIEDAP